MNIYLLRLVQCATTVQQTGQLDTVYEESSTIIEFTLPEIWKWHSRWKPQHEDFRVFGCLSEDRSIIILMKYPVHIMVFGHR